jgi:hypothetical protein
MLCYAIYLVCDHDTYMELIVLQSQWGMFDREMAILLLLGGVNREVLILEYSRFAPPACCFRPVVVLHFLLTPPLI